MKVTLGAKGTWAILFKNGTVQWCISQLLDEIESHFQVTPGCKFLCFDCQDIESYLMIGGILFHLPFYSLLYFFTLEDAEVCFARGPQDLIQTLFEQRYQYRILSDSVYFLQDSINYEFQNGNSIYDLAKDIATRQVHKCLVFFLLLLLLKIINNNGLLKGECRICANN